jgi:hypothetical protein
MTAGLVVVTAGIVLMTRIGLHTSYLSGVLPVVVVFAVGLAAVVAPLTAAITGLRTALDLRLPRWEVVERRSRFNRLCMRWTMAVPG